MYSQKGFFSSMVQSKSYSFIRFSIPTWLIFWSTTTIILPNHKFSNKLGTLIEPNELTYLNTYLILYATDILLEIFQFPILLKMLILPSDIHILSLVSTKVSTKTRVNSYFHSSEIKQTMLACTKVFFPWMFSTFESTTKEIITTLFVLQSLQTNSMLPKALGFKSKINSKSWYI